MISVASTNPLRGSAASRAEKAAGQRRWQGECDGGGFDARDVRERRERRVLLWAGTNWLALASCDCDDYVRYEFGNNSSLTTVINYSPLQVRRACPIVVGCALTTGREPG